MTICVHPFVSVVPFYSPTTPPFDKLWAGQAWPEDPTALLGGCLGRTCGGIFAHRDPVQCNMSTDHSTTRPAGTEATRSAPAVVQQTILFDGVCNLCNGFVQFVIKHDRADRFRFGALQSDAAKLLLSRKNLEAADLSTVLYLRGDRLLVRSSAALHIFRDLGGLWSLAFVFMLVPRFLRDMVYNWMAKNRYRWFGKRESCMVPTPELRTKFLDHPTKTRQIPGKRFAKSF